MEQMMKLQQDFKMQMKKQEQVSRQLCGPHCLTAMVDQIVDDILYDCLTSLKTRHLIAGSGYLIGRIIE